MADLSNSSFIPKRGPVKRREQGSSRRVYVFTLISYTLIFATLLGAGGVFFYSKYIRSLLAEEVSLLNTEINSFNSANMKAVQDFDSRLKQASDRLNHSASVTSIFSLLEASTIDTVKIVSLDINRESDTKFVLGATIETDSFDSTIFQRGVYGEEESMVSTVSFKNVRRGGAETNSNDTDSDSSAEYSGEPIVSFEAEIEVPLSAVPYEPVSVSEPFTVVNPSPVPADDRGDADTQDDNQADI